MPAEIKIDDDVFAAAERIAQRSDMSVGEVVSRLSRESLGFSGGNVEYRNGIRLLPVSEPTPVTVEMVQQLAEDIEWEEYAAKADCGG